MDFKNAATNKNLKDQDQKINDNCRMIQTYKNDIKTEMQRAREL